MLSKMPETSFPVQWASKGNTAFSTLVKLLGQIDEKLVVFLF